MYSRTASSTSLSSVAVGCSASGSMVGKSGKPGKPSPSGGGGKPVGISGKPVGNSGKPVKSGKNGSVLPPLSGLSSPPPCIAPLIYDMELQTN